MIRIYERTVIERFTFSTVGTDSTGGGPLEFTTAKNEKFLSGILRGVSISCDSTDFDVSIRTATNAQADTPGEIYRATDIEKYRNDDNLGVGWINVDDPKEMKLYLVLVNNDIVRPTGTITVELMSDINKRFSGNR